MYPKPIFNLILFSVPPRVLLGHLFFFWPQIFLQCFKSSQFLNFSILLNCIFVFFSQLSDGSLEDNCIVDGSRITLLPRAETGLLVSYFASTAFTYTWVRKSSQCNSSKVTFTRVCVLLSPRVCCGPTTEGLNTVSDMVHQFSSLPLAPRGSNTRTY